MVEIAYVVKSQAAFLIKSHFGFIYSFDFEKGVLSRT